MSFKKIFTAVILSFALFGLSSSAFAKETHKSVPEVLKEVDAKIQIVLDAIPAGDAQQVATLIKDVAESASELSANYKFEFERDKVVLKMKKARELAKKSDFAGAESEIKAAREGFANLKKYM